MKYAMTRSLSILAAAFALATAVGIATRAAPQTSAAKSASTSSETFTRTIEDGGTGAFKAVVAGDASLTTHSIFRPKDLAPFGEKAKLPIVVWGNGACANSPQPVVNFLSEIASHGFLVIAIGPTPATEPTVRRDPPGSASRSSQMLDAIDWATAQNADKSSAYFGKIDTSKIAVIGHSCGGLQALEVSPDPRISTTVVCDSGILSPAPARGGTATAPAPTTTAPAATTTATATAAATRAATAPARGGGMGMPPLTKDHLAKLHAPVLYILGGASDIATPNGTDDFRRIEKIPAYFASIDVGHAGTFGRPHGGEFAPVTVAWFKWQLKGDAEAGKMFTGNPSGLSKVPGWTVDKKNIP
jgi:dienelactone hydrolase